MQRVTLQQRSALGGDPRWSTVQRQWRQQRRRNQCCTAEAGGSGAGAPGQPSRDDMLARIAKAREYKRDQQAKAAVTAAAPIAPGVAAEESSTGVDVEQAFNEAAQVLASKEEAEFLQAVSESRSSRGSGGGGTMQRGPPSTPADQAAASKEAMLARINAARKYNKQQGSTDASGSIAGSPVSGVHMSPPPPAQQPAAAALQQQQQLSEEEQRSFRTGMGGAEKAANWLTFADASVSGSESDGEGVGPPQIDSSLSAEQFTIAKEELKKQQEVEIITVDANYAKTIRRQKREDQGLGAEEQDEGQEQRARFRQERVDGVEGEPDGEMHQPKVATWGIFPRPKSISQTYGGGRNLRPGQALETEEEAAARDKRVSAALQQYRKTLGLDIDPAVEQEAQALYDEGTVLLEQGLISTALIKFTGATELMALRSRLGGEARLQQAICLDSLGRNQEAYEVYKKIEGHSAPGVAKKVKRMLFGWKAAEQLKANRISYAPTTTQWKRYFDVINRNSLYAGTYVPAEGEEEGGGSSEAGAAALALAVVVLPLAFVAYFIWVK